jgi:hypothetical protein
MTTIQLQDLARVGAETRLKAIVEEREALLRAFPDLGNGAATRASLAALMSTRAPTGMSPAQRKAVGERMKAYWAKRRGEKAGAKNATRKARRKSGMSAEARRRQGERMRAYWAARRTQKVDGAVEGTRSDTARQDGAFTSKRGAKAGRKQGRKK